MSFGMNRYGIFKRFVLSYIILLVIMLAVFGLAYTEMRSYALEDVIEREHILLERAQTIIDERLREVDNVISQLSQSVSIKEFRSVQAPLADADYYRLYDVYENLPNYGLTNSFFSDLLIYFPRSNSVISTFGASSDPGTFYGSALRYQGMEYRQWKARLTGPVQPARLWESAAIEINGKTARYLTYSRALASNLSDSEAPIASVFIEEPRILTYFMALKPASDQYVEIADKNGRIVASYGGLEPSSKAKTAEVSVVSQITGLNYTLIKPVADILSQVHEVRDHFLIITLVALVLGLCSALILAYRNSMPIRRVASLMSAWAGGRQNKHQSEYEVITGTVSELLVQNSELTEEMEKRLPLLRAGCLERLLTGGFSTETEAEAVLKYMGLHVHDQGYWVGIVRIAGHDHEVPKLDLKRMDSERLRVRQVIERKLGPDMYLHEYEIDKLILLVRSDDYCLDKDFDTLIAETEGYLSEQIGIHITCGISNRHTRLVDAPLAMKQALLALDHLERHADMRIHRFSNIPTRRMGYHYPIEAESRLFNLIRIGEQSEAEALVDEILQENFVDRELPTAEVRQLMHEFKGTICKLRDEIFVNGSRYKASELNKIVSAIDGCSSAEEFSNSVKSGLGYMCATVNERKRSHNVDLIESITNFLNTHYHDPNLTLYVVASHFDLTETYLSQFFKEQTGENYSAYLEKARIAEARRLLIESDITVSEVARRVGYMINSTFYRAFKRVYGVSPSTYKEQFTKIHGDRLYAPERATDITQSHAL